MFGISIDIWRVSIALNYIYIYIYIYSDFFIYWVFALYKAIPTK